ncbi:MAG: GyrI-like domain-containing protein [Clostridia bacterium]|nr:GyrI-like domain-containing protein [Clostridia bacterium]
MEIIAYGPFSVIGKEGSTQDGNGFVARLWEEANSHFQEVSPLAKRDANGNLVGVWGLMTDFSRRFLPWQEDFTQGLYLAGVECRDDAEVPSGWVKWTVPAFVFLKVKNDGDNVFPRTIQALPDMGYRLAGAVQDYTCPGTGEEYMLFPVEPLKEE